MKATHTDAAERRAGCDVCHGRAVTAWTGPTALALAARHHEATGHPTWAEQVIACRWGDRVVFDEPRLPGV